MSATVASNECSQYALISRQLFLKVRKLRTKYLQVGKQGFRPSVCGLLVSYSLRTTISVHNTTRVQDPATPAALHLLLPFPSTGYRFHSQLQLAGCKYACGCESG